jgi:hypothetical protein
MPTAAEFAHFPDKRLLGSTDFDARFFRYLRNESREAIKRLFIQGSFLERMPLSAPSANRIQVGAKPTYGDRMAHDGDGHLLDLSLIDTSTVFANANAQVYEVGAGYIEYPKGIRTNPRTGAPEYDRYVEGIGVEATPATVINNGSTLTFLINSLFEAGTTVASHAGRSVRVFKKLLAPNARTEALAIEVATVTYDGANNRITTVGLLGQTVVSTTPADYVVQLSGLNVLRLQATNRPSLLPAKFFFLGTVTGNGGTPSSFVTTAQGVIRSQDAALVTMAALGAWADGTLNPSGYVQGVVAKIVSDLTSVEVGTGRGLAKITAPDLTGTPVPVAAARADVALQKILDATNAATRRAERSSENQAVQALRLVATSPSGATRQFMGIAASLSAGGALTMIVCVGSQCCTVWDANTGFTHVTHTLPLASVAYGPSGWFAAGDDTNVTGNIYQMTGTPGTYAWVLSQSTGGRMSMIAYSAAANAYVAVGPSARIHRTVTGGAWTTPTPPAEIGTEDIVGVACSPTLIVALTSVGKIITSTNGSSWTFRGYVGAVIQQRSLYYSPEFGFVCLTHTGGGANVGLAYSTDGLTWLTSALTPMVSANIVMAPLDRQLALIKSYATVTPTYFSTAFTMPVLDVPAIDGNVCVLPLVEPAFEARFVAHIAGQVFAGGRNAGGFGVLYMGGNFRPSFRSPGLGENP